MKTGRRYKGIVTLAALLLFVPWLAWRLALKDTVSLWCSYRAERAAVDSLECVARKEKAENGQSVSVTDSREWIQSGLLLDTLLAITAGKGVKVAEYTPYVTDSQAEMTVRTAEVVLSGGFIPVLRTIDLYERSPVPCRLCSVSFAVVENRAARTRQLRATLLLWQITRNP